MTDRPDHERPEHDEVVSAAIDGEATPDEVARVASDPVLQARRSQLEAAAAVAGTPVEPPAAEARDAAVAAALAAYDGDRRAPAGHERAVAPVVALASRRMTRWLGIAAAALVVVAAGALVLRSRDDNRSSTTAARESSGTAEANAFSAVGAPVAGAADGATGQGATSGAGTGGAATAAPAAAGGSSGGVAPTVDLGPFATADEVAAAVKRRLGASSPPTTIAGSAPSAPFSCPPPPALTATDLAATATLAGQQVLVLAGATAEGRTVYILDASCTTIAVQPLD